MRRLGSTVTLIGALLSLGTAAAQVAIDVVPGAQTSRPARPERPTKGPSPSERPDLTEIKDIIKTFQAEKREYLNGLHEKMTTPRDLRVGVREQLNETRLAIRPLIQDFHQSIQDAKRQALEQSRKVADEAKATARDRRE